MIRKQEPKAVMTAIMVCVAALGCLGFVVLNRAQGLQAQAASVTAPDTTGWSTYRNATYGFTLQYPSTWVVDMEGLAGDPPFVLFGNPLGGLKTYTLGVFIENNTSSLSSGEYAHALLAAAKAEDAKNAAQGPAPQIAPIFARAMTLTVGGYPAYELYRVFEFDHHAERIYVAHGAIALRFDFPVAEENPNLSLPVANNGIAHEIANTLVFTK